MNEQLKQTLKLLPSLPGCYIYYNKEGEVIYVGKAKILKRRVLSYFNRKHHDSVKVQVLVSQIEKLEYIITNTEVEALILESHLIKKHKPRYNILLKDDKKYPYFLITDEDFPRISIVRKKKSKPGKRPLLRALYRYTRNACHIRFSQKSLSTQAMQIP